MYFMYFQILSMVEEAAGTRLYESKKSSAQRTIEKKDSKLREIEKVSTCVCTCRVRNYMYMYMYIYNVCMKSTVVLTMYMYFYTCACTL